MALPNNIKNDIAIGNFNKMAEHINEGYLPEPTDHEQNKDQYIDKGGVSQCTAAELKAAVVGGTSGYSGASGYSGVSGYSGAIGVSGYSGAVGDSGYSGASGASGVSGYSGIEFEPQVTNILYVDSKRSDSYTPNGSIAKPFLKIQDAIDAIVSPSATNKYLIEIAPGPYYSDAITVDEIYVTFRSCGVQGARISGKITVTNPSSPTPEQITFIGLRISGGLECLSSHICINAVDCNVTGSAWVMNPTAPTDDEYLQVFGGLWNVTTTLTNVYTYLMGGGYYSTFAATNCEFNINNADINVPFQVTLSGTVIASAYGNRAGSSAFILNTGSTLYMDADTEGGSVLTMSGGTLVRTTKAASIVNTPAGAIASTDVQAAINELDTEKPTISSGTGVPGTTPTKVGDVFVDTNNKKLYFATGISSSSDWTAAN